MTKNTILTGFEPELLIQTLPRGLSYNQAAWYVGVAADFFDDMIHEGMMPEPKQIGSQLMWDRWEVDIAFQRLPYSIETNFSGNG